MDSRKFCLFVWCWWLAVRSRLIILVCTSFRLNSWWAPSNLCIMAFPIWNSFVLLNRFSFPFQLSIGMWLRNSFWNSWLKLPLYNQTNIFKGGKKIISNYQNKRLISGHVHFLKYLTIYVQRFLLPPTSHVRTIHFLIHMQFQQYCTQYYEFICFSQYNFPFQKY